MLRERLVSAAFAAGWTLVCRVPESWARAVFRFGADIAWRRQGHGVQVLEGNLLRVLGPGGAAGAACGAGVDGKELRVMSRAAMRSYARYYLETFRLQTFPKERIDDGMHIVGPNVAATLEQLKNGRGVIYALPHMGMIEQAGAWIVNNGAGSFTTVVERLKPESVYQRFTRFRESLGMEVVPTTGGPHPFGVLAQRLRAGKLVCILADRDLSDTGVEVDFFGEKALMAAGAAVLAVRTGAALMPVTCWFVGEAEWAAEVHDEIVVPASGTAREKVAVMMQRLANVFEQAIREHPEDWHMLQKVFVADLDPERLAQRRAQGAGDAPAPGSGTDGNAGNSRASGADGADGESLTGEAGEVSGAEGTGGLSGAGGAGGTGP